MKFSIRLLVALAALAMIPAVAQACPACMVTDPQNAGTYLGMTLMMSALPLGMVGGLAYWLWRRYSQAARASSRPRKAAGQPKFLTEIRDAPRHPSETA